MIVKQARIGVEKLRFNVKMRVNHVGDGYFACALKPVIGYKHKFGIFLLDCLVEYIKTAVIFVTPVFIADSKVF